MEEGLAFRILQYAGLQRDYSELFASHEIDDIAIGEMQEEHLREMGITNERHRRVILSTRDKCLGAPSNEESPSSSGPEPSFRTSPITVGMLVKATPSQTKTKQESNEDFLKRIHIVRLTDRSLTHMSNIDLCLRLQALYLSSNRIHRIEHLDSLQHLRILYLDNNCLNKMEGMTELGLLEQLFLDRNYIQTLEGLQNCQRLQELHISGQKIQGEMTIEELSFVGISGSLRKAHLANNGITDVSHFWFFDSLQELDLSGNAIPMDEELIKALGCMKQMQKLALANNPVAARKKYRDEIILCCPSILELDNKEIHPNEKQYIFRLKGKRLSVNKNGKSKAEKNGANVLEVIGNKLDN